MQIIELSKTFKIKKSERTILMMLDRNRKPTQDFILLLGVKAHKLAADGKVREK